MAVRAITHVYWGIFYHRQEKRVGLHCIMTVFLACAPQHSLT